jgi:hypothetical protein
MLMQPDDQKNYGESGANEPQSNAPQEMYQPPEPAEDEALADETYEEVADDFDDDSLIHWSANEYINTEKNGTWFVGFAAVALAFIAVDIFLIKSYTFSVLIVVMALAVIVLSKRPPRVLHYSMSGQGLYIGEKLYHFSEFKSFGVLSNQDQHSVMLIPIKRFSPGVTVYFPYEAGEKIVDILGARLPMQELKLDIIDHIVQKLRL